MLTIVIVILNGYGTGMLMVTQQIDCLIIEIQCFVAGRTYGAYGHAQFAQNHLVAFDAFVILQRLRTHIVVTGIE